MKLSEYEPALHLSSITFWPISGGIRMRHGLDVCDCDQYRSILRQGACMEQNFGVSETWEETSRNDEAAESKYTCSPPLSSFLAFRNKKE